MNDKKDPDNAPVSEYELFRSAVAGVKPIANNNRHFFRGERPRPVPLQSLRDQREVLADSLSDFIPYDIEHDINTSFLRNGLPKQTLRKLQARSWTIQAHLDLHGLTSDEAREQLVTFLDNCRKRHCRCVRIIHGKGLRSKNREPVLKHKVRSWLMQRDEILAFCEARPVDGGSGAVLVLLKVQR